QAGRDGRIKPRHLAHRELGAYTKGPAPVEIKARYGRRQEREEFGRDHVVAKDGSKARQRYVYARIDERIGDAHRHKAPELHKRRVLRKPEAHAEYVYQALNDVARPDG